MLLNWNNPRTNVVRFANELTATAKYCLDTRLLAALRSSDRTKMITYLTYAGLGNRLRAHYFASLVGAKVGRTVYPIWINTKHLASDGHDIFRDAVKKAQERRVPRWLWVRSSRINAKTLADECSGRGDDSLLLLDYDAQWIPFGKSRVVLQDTSVVSVSIQDNICEAAKKIIESWRGPYLSVHVRQTDFISHTVHAKPALFFSERIKEAVLGKDGEPFRTLVVASDDVFDVPDNIADMFERVIILNPTLQRNARGVAKEALAHLLCIATADAFIPSPKSSFSEFVNELMCGYVKIDNFPIINSKASRKGV